MLDILYCSTMCSEKVFTEMRIPFGGQQVINYHRNLLKGLNAQNDISIKTISRINIMNKSKATKVVKRELWNGIELNYLKMKDSSLFTRIYQVVISFFMVLKFTNNKSVVCLDVLPTMMAFGVTIACKLKRLKLVGIVTDMPIPVNGKDNLVGKLSKIILNRCNAYLLLTEQMNDVFNSDRKKPYIVLEGQVNSNMSKIDNSLRNKDKPRVILNAGTLTKENGIDILIEGFNKAKLENTELHIYGDGKDVEYVKKVAEQNQNIKYCGCLLSSEVVKKEISATLLINPRPSNQEFVKYSFPSKLMEYLASGTPVLTTRLCGIPQDYYPHIYTIDKEDSDGICEALKKIGALADEDLHKKGMDAKEFIIKNKNEIVQGKKFFELIKKVADM